ncbi:MAG: hypothetical protein ACI4D4_07430 [Lachnospira sp.]
MNESNKYNDIINLSHPTSKKHPRMSMLNRAAQFAPFAALTGYEDEVTEAGRLTEDFAELNEDEKNILDRKLAMIMEQNKGSNKPSVNITYFKPDEKKKGGAYVTYTGTIKKINYKDAMIITEDNIGIPIKFIYDLDCPSLFY